jgi:hypothetical protein
MHNADGNRAVRTESIFETVPADGHHGCQLEENGEFGTSPFFGQLFACRRQYWRVGDKEQ